MKRALYEGCFFRFVDYFVVLLCGVVSRGETTTHEGIEELFKATHFVGYFSCTRKGRGGDSPPPSFT